MFNDYYRRRLLRPIRKLPDFIIMGTQKGGTTFLFHHLCQHPGVLEPQDKELHFFNQRAHENIDNYKHHFPSKIRTFFNPRLISGEATPDYMIYPQVPELIHKHMPNAKLILLLKNPIDRAFSHYKHNLSMRREWYSFEDALEYEEIRTNLDYIDIYTTRKDAIKNYCNFSYKRKGVYVEQVQWIYKYFKRDQVLIVQSERLFSEPNRIIPDIMKFLGLRPIAYTSYPAKGVSKIDMPLSSSTREKLSHYFKDYNESLFSLTGKSFDWD